MAPAPFLIADETYVLPATLPVPCRGLQHFNPLLIRGREPMLVDTSAAVLRDEFLDAAFSLVDPGDVRWIFLSHDDRDHAGNLLQLLDLCPRAQVVTNFQGLNRLSKEWVLPLDRLIFVNDGERFSIGDRTLLAMRPPLFDSPASRGLWDERTRVFFAVDSFCAIVPAYCEVVDDLADDVYAAGFSWLNRANTPWIALADPRKLDEQVNRVRRLGPHTIVSYHGPVAHGRTAQLCDMLAGLPEATDPVSFPSHDDVLVHG
jgi:flavorubredoxin